MVRVTSGHLCLSWLCDFHGLVHILIFAIPSFLFLGVDCYGSVKSAPCFKFWERQVQNFASSVGSGARLCME